MAAEIKLIKGKLDDIQKAKEKLNLNGAIFVNKKLDNIHERVKLIYEEVMHIRSLKNLGTK